MSSQENQFNVVVAIDFGTDGLGVAYAFQDNVFVHDKWNSKRYGSVVKPKAIILLDDEQEVVAVGMDAKHNYMSLTDIERNEWMLFERFKMALYDTKLTDDEKVDVSDNNKIDIKSELIAINGKTCSSEKVFIAAFQHIHKICNKYLRKNKIKVNNEDIQWIITVPAIWNDDAKNKMKSWAIKSGLIDENINNQCKIVYEPDCAALAIQHHMKQTKNIYYDKKKMRRKQQNNTENNYETEKIADCHFEKGDKYILIDAGGGTVDIACHEILGEFGVKEILPPSGGKWGSTYIDDEYVKLLEGIFTNKWIEEFKKAAPNNYVELIHNFQIAKCSFYADPHAKMHNVELSFTFLSFVEEKIVDKMEKDEQFKRKQENVEPGEYAEYFIENAEVYEQKNLLLIDEQRLSINTQVWEIMFDEVLIPIINHIKKLFQQITCIGECKYLCLVGGLSCSPYFQYRMRSEFGATSPYKLNIIIPKRPILSVVEGAAYFGITKDFVRARKLKYSYGVMVNCLLEHAMEKNVSLNHILSNKYFNERIGRHFVKRCVDTLAKKKEEIYVSESKVKTYSKHSPDSDRILVRVWCSDQFNPKTIEDVEILGHLWINLDNGDQDSDVFVEFLFGGTMLKICAYAETEPNNKKELELKYASDI